MSSIFDALPSLFVQHLGDREAFPYTHGTTTVDVKGIVEMPAMNVDGFSENQIVDADASLHCATADLPTGYGDGDSVVVRGISYRVKAPMPDGRGMVRLPLMRV